jgi:two-component system response regulator AtoC
MFVRFLLLLLLLTASVLHASPQPEDSPENAIAGFVGPSQIIGNCPKMVELMALLKRAAASPMPVLITGETGTGKELVARFIHQNSPRRGNVFRAQNMAAIPESLAESLLFGHEKGAFSGASGKTIGLFGQAEGGTLFLDELGETPLALQSKLLRVMSNGGYTRVGGHELIFPNVRIVAATNRKLADEIRRKTFREDLFYRLAAMTFHLPPLRERKEDIPAIANGLLARHAGGRPLTLSSAAIELLEAQPWPGNIRQLEGVIESAIAFTDGNEILPEALRLDQIAALSHQEEPLIASAQDWVRQQNPAAMRESLEAVERQYIIWALEQNNWDPAAAAGALKMPVAKIKTKIRQYQIIRP